MPHHSAQKRQINAFPGSPHTHTMMGSASPGGMPPRNFGPTRGADFGMMQHHPSPQGIPVQHHQPQQHQHHPHTSMRGHPHHVAMTSWMPSPSQQQMRGAGVGVHGGGGIIHRVADVHGDEHSAYTGHSRSRDADESTTPRSLSKGGSASFDSSNEVAASVLLLAASAMKKENLARTPSKGASDTDYVDDTTADRTVPLKKRKKAADIMRKKIAEPMSTICHVSPHSEMSKIDSTSAGSAANTPNTHSSSVVRRTASAADGSPSSSYDLKDGQALPDSAKIKDAKEISMPPTHVEIPHFPSVLHAVLTESEFAGSVLQWFPHGQSWRIVRWDALRRQVLPKYFSQLREEDSKDASASIDAFLWHLSAWGFEEVTDGPDVGGYTHVLFRRELPRLCREMRFVPASGNKEPLDTEPKYATDGSARSILQVPSLASTYEPTRRSSMDTTEEKKDEFSPGSRSHSHRPICSPGWPNHQYHHPEMMTAGAGPNGPPPTVIYRPEAVQGGESWTSFSEHQPHWVGTPISTPTQQSRPSVPPYSPIRVRSSRGACRLALNRVQVSNQQQIDSCGSPAMSNARSSFPVSNRGKGKAGPRRPATFRKSDSLISSGSIRSVATEASNAITTAEASSGTAVSVAAAAVDTSVVAIPSSAPREDALPMSQPSVHATVTATDTPTPPPRPILKRKLPMMLSRTKPSASEDSADSSSSSGSSTTVTTSTTDEHTQKLLPLQSQQPFRQSPTE